MDGKKYKKLLTEVFALMRGEALNAAIALEKSAMRVDAVQDLMRNAILKSSISKFNGQPYYFSGRIYEEMSWDDFGNLIYDLMRKCELPMGDYARIEGVLKVCRRAVSGKTLKPNNAIMIFRNCVFDMETKQTHAFHARYVQVTQVDYDFDPENYPYQWKTFLQQVLPSERIRQVLQEFLGSIFINRHDAKMETMLILRGSGSNGKSVVFETVTGILGKDNVSNFGIGALISGGERKKNIAFINGKRLNYCSEIQAMEIGKDSDALKALISGEPIEARPLYGENFTAYNLPLLMANANRMPYIKDWSYGMRRRILILPFEVEIPRERQHKTLAKDLEDEYPGIFNWMLEGRDRFIKNGYKLTESAELETVLDEYQSESSSVMNFMFHMNYLCRYEQVTHLEPQWVTSHELYHKYKQWCVLNDVTPESVTMFGRILVDAGYKKKRTPDGVIYGVYGKPVYDKLVYKNRKAKGHDNGSYKQRLSKPILHNGVRWAKTIEGLGYCLKIPFYKVKVMLDGGMLEGMWHKEGRTHYFNLDMIEPKLKELLSNFRTSQYEKKERKMEPGVED